MGFLNGKKTVIGTLLLGLAFMLTKAGLGMPCGEGDEGLCQWMPLVIDILGWLGAAMGGVGAVHKGVKGELKVRVKA